MKLGLIGDGTMGKLVRGLAEEKGHQIFASIDESYASWPGAKLSDKLKGCDVAIDFSTAEAVRRNVEACMTAGVPLVEGTTGWSSKIEEIEKLVSTAGGALVYGANFSIGVNLFYRITNFAAEIFARFPEYETFIEEQHHSRKMDAPSGTALKLKDIVSRHIEKDFSVSSTRAGNIPGTHRVGFDGPADQSLLEHTARSRDGFAAGALMAAEWVVGKKGFYEFTDVIDELCATDG
ncbi:MAG: dihydrodipicolinate reductase C-terminal domain-containing protein [Pyrinomonadaceae bacterium]